MDANAKEKNRTTSNYQMSQYVIERRTALYGMLPSTPFVAICNHQSVRVRVRVVAVACSVSTHCCLYMRTRRSLKTSSHNSLSYAFSWKTVTDMKRTRAHVCAPKHTQSFFFVSLLR